MNARATEIAWLRAAARSGEASLIRRRAGLSHADIARDLGVDRSTVSRWEQQRSAPRGPVALRYARLLRRLDRQLSVSGQASA